MDLTGTECFSSALYKLNHHEHCQHHRKENADKKFKLGKSPFPDFLAVKHHVAAID